MGTKRTRGPVWLIVGGAAAMVVGAVLFITGIVSTARTVVDELSPAIDPTQHLIGATSVPGEGPAVRLVPDRYQVVVVGDDLVTTTTGDDGTSDVVRRPFSEPGVRVTGPDGEVAVSAPTVERLVRGTEDVVAIGEFRVEETGRYSLTVTGEGNAVRLVAFAERPDLAESLGRALRWSGLVLAGVAVGLAGLAALIGGIIWSATSRPRPPLVSSPGPWSAPPPPPPPPPAPRR